MGKLVTLIAAKSLRYAGKALRAGDPFVATTRDARVFTAARLATYDTRDQDRAPRLVRPTPPAPPPLSDPEPDPVDLAALRAEYADLAGQRPLNFWKSERLTAEIERLRAEKSAAEPIDEPLTDDE